MNSYFQDIAARNGLNTAAGVTYGLLSGCFVTLREEDSARHISIYVGPKEQPAPGYTESRTASCAQQICHTIHAAGGPDNRYALAMREGCIPMLILKDGGCIVEAVFQPSPDSDSGVALFINEILPQIASLTRPNVCFCCGRETQGAGFPAVLSDGESVAPLHGPCYNEYAGIRPPSKEEKDAQTRAILFAAVGALISALAWCLLSGFGPIAWVVGILMGLLPTLAYDWQKGIFGRKRIITVAVCAAIAVLLGSIGATMLKLMDSYQLNLTAYTAKAVSFWAYVPAGIAEDPAIAGSLLKALIAGGIFSAIGCLSLLRKPDDVPLERPANAYPLRLKGKC